MKNTKRFLWMLFSAIAYTSAHIACSGFLDKEASKNLTTPSSLKDLQALLDNHQNINSGVAPGVIEGRTDDFFIGQGGFNNLTVDDQAIYSFKESSYFLPLSNWFDPYVVISRANTVLDEMEGSLPSKGVNTNYLRGTALFHRAFAHFQLAQVFCEVYDPKKNGSSIKGIPYKTSSDVMEGTARNTLQETYNFIERDLLESVNLLPVHVEYLTRPSRAAAFATLSRLYLSKSDFEKAGHYADQALNIHDELLDFNELDTLSPYPIPMMNKETFLFSEGGGLSALLPNRECYVDTILFNSYAVDDLRKVLFFRPEIDGLVSFKGSYLGYASGSSFVGPTTSEMFLIRSECNARSGRVYEALNDLNQLLRSRWKKDCYIEIKEADPQVLLDLILAERRKELIMRGVRWMDLKRLNLEERYKKDISRQVYGLDESYVLKANSSAYVYPIPQEVIVMTEIDQN